MKTHQRLQRRENIWNQAQQKQKIFNQKVKIKKARVHDNPLVNNLGFDILNLQYKQTRQGI